MIDHNDLDYMAAGPWPIKISKISINQTKNRTKGSVHRGIIRY